MSLVLTSAGEKLEITATVVIPFTVHYADYVGATPAFTPGVAAGDTINGTKDLLAAPGSGQRVVRTISVHNDSGGADTITIQLDDGGTNYTIVTAMIPDNYALYYDEDGWKVLDKNGALATILFAHTLLGPHHSDTATGTPTRGSMIVVPAMLTWDELVIGGAHQILKVNAGGTDPAWTSFDWDDMAAGAAADMVHTHGSAAEGGVDLGPLDSATMAEDAWVGIGAALERLVFDGSAGAITVMGADLGVGVTPLRLFHISDGAGDFAYIHMTTDATGNLSTDGFTVGYRSDTPEAIIRNRENSLLTLWTNNTIRMTIAAAGAVKIASLAGAGARNVVAAADGTLSAP